MSVETNPLKKYYGKQLDGVLILWYDISLTQLLKMEKKDKALEQEFTIIMKPLKEISRKGNFFKIPLIIGSFGEFLKFFNESGKIFRSYHQADQQIQRVLDEIIILVRTIPRKSKSAVVITGIQQLQEFRKKFDTAEEIETVPDSE